MATFQTLPGSGGLLQPLPAPALPEQPELHFAIVIRPATKFGLRQRSGRPVPALASLTTAVQRGVTWPAQDQQPTHICKPRPLLRPQQGAVSQGVVQQLQQCQVQASTVQIKQLPTQQFERTEQQKQNQQHGKHRTADPVGPLKPCQNGLEAVLATLSQAKLLVAGAMSAVVSRTAMAPLERVRSELHVSPICCSP